jgi:hypothetical protein
MTRFQDGTRAVKLSSPLWYWLVSDSCYENMPIKSFAHTKVPAEEKAWKVTVNFD